MRRGTTPTHIFNVPFEIPENSEVRIVYAQNGEIILEKTTESCTLDRTVVKVKLTAEETLLFDCSDHNVGGWIKPYPVEIQLGIRTAEGDKLWSDIIVDTAERCIREDGVI